MSTSVYSAMAGYFLDAPARGDQSRVKRMGWRAATGSKEFNTERTENHGAARRFFGPDRRASDRRRRPLGMYWAGGAPLVHRQGAARRAYVAARKRLQHEGREECTKNARSIGSRIHDRACAYPAALAPNFYAMNLRAFFVVLHVLRVKILTVVKRIGTMLVPRPTTPDALPRTVGGPASPCCSVVLRALRVKSLLCPARNPIREAACALNTGGSP